MHLITLKKQNFSREWTFMNGCFRHITQAQTFAKICQIRQIRESFFP